MKKILCLLACLYLPAAPTYAQPQATLEDVARELAALSDRVGKLEEANARLVAENESLRAANDRLEATSEYLKDNASATRKQLAEEGPKVEEAARVAKAAEWASRLSWKADLRYRHEMVDPSEAIDEQVRHRIRARLAMTAKINETLTGTIGLATGGGAGDPRSTNETLGSSWTRKQVALDLAYVDWKPIDGLVMTFGKQPQPWYKASGYFFDSDITPEGISTRYARGPVFASAFGYYLSERSTASDATLLGGQLGVTGTLGPAKLTGAVGYFDVGGVQGKVTTTGLAPCVANGAFFLGPWGNTTDTDADGCQRLRYDYNTIEAIANAEFSLGRLPAQVFAQYVRNPEADDLDSGWAAGFTVGRASDAHTWDFGYTYADIGKDALFGQFVDSDIAGGFTDFQGSVFKVGYAPAKNWVLNGTYYLTDRFVDGPGATERDYERYQIDLNWKF